MSLGGIIAGALSGAAKGAGEVADYGIQQQQKIDYAKALTDMQTEKELLIDATKRDRDRAEETRKLSPEYLEAVGKADLTKGQISARNRTTLAPVNAAADKVEYDAKKPLEDTKAVDATKRKITETTTLAGDKDYVRGVGTLDVAGAQGEIATARARASAETGKKLDPRISARVKVIDDELGDISKAITKAKAEGMWDPKSENAQSLVNRQRQLQNQMLELLDAGGVGGAGGGDGTLRNLLFGKDNSAAPAAAPAPKEEPKPTKTESKANVTDPNSPAGQFQARNQAQAQERESARAARMRETQTSFNTDFTTMEPIDLVSKYNDLRGMLTREQLVKLKQQERKL